MAAPMTASGSNMDLYAHGIAAINGGDFEGFRELLSPELVHADRRRFGGGVVEGRDRVLTYFRSLT